MTKINNLTIEQFIKDISSNKTSDDKEYLTIKDACRITKVSRWTITKMLKMTDAKGNYLIRWSKLGRLVRIDKASFCAFLESYDQHANTGKEA